MKNMKRTRKYFLINSNNVVVFIIKAARDIVMFIIHFFALSLVYIHKMHNLDH